MQKTIQVLDKEFTLHIPYETLQGKIYELAQQLQRETGDSNPLFVVMLNGAFMFAAELMKNYNLPAEMSFVKYSSYTGTQSSGNVDKLIGLTNNIEGRNVIIIEDIVESGLTMKCCAEMLKAQGAASVKIAALFVKPNCMIHDVKVDYPVLEIDDDFIVGFGLDYNGYGRNYKDIYKLK